MASKQEQAEKLRERAEQAPERDADRLFERAGQIERSHSREDGVNVNKLDPKKSPEKQVDALFSLSRLLMSVYNKVEIAGGDLDEISDAQSLNRLVNKHDVELDASERLALRRIIDYEGSASGDTATFVKRFWPQTISVYEVSRSIGRFDMNTLKKELERAIEKETGKKAEVGKKGGGPSKDKEQPQDAPKKEPKIPKNVGSFATDTAFRKIIVDGYSLDRDKFSNRKREEITAMQSEIDSALLLLSGDKKSIKVERIEAVYKKALEEKRKEIPLAELGLSGHDDIDEEGLFHACAIIASLKKYYSKISESDVNKMSTGEFLDEVCNDPSIKLAHDFQQAITKNMTENNIRGPQDLVLKASEVFNGSGLNEAFDASKEVYIENLIQKYKTESYEQLKTEEEKAELVEVIVGFYTSDVNLDKDPHTLKGQANNFSKNEKVIEAAVDLIQNVRKDVDSNIIPGIVEKYDIKREDNKKFDSVLHTFFNDPNERKKIRIRDAIQLSVLSNGISFKAPKPELQGEFDNAKDLALVYAVLHILEKYDPVAHERYAANLGNIATNEVEDLTVSCPNLAPVVPHLQKVTELAYENVKTRMRKLLAIVEGNEDISWMAEIPLDVVLAVVDNWPDPYAINKESFWPIFFSIDGAAIYNPDENHRLGLVWVAGKWYVVDPIATGLGAAWAQLKDPLNPTAGLKSYALNVVPYVFWCAGSSAVVGAIRGGKMGALRGLISGTGRGLVAPAAIPLKTARTFRDMGRWLDQYGRAWKHGRGNAKSLQIATDRYLEYLKKAPTDEALDLVQYGKAYIKDPAYQTKRVLMADAYEASKKAWARRFKWEYNRFYEVNIYTQETQSSLVLNPGESAEKIEKTAIRTRKVIKRIAQIPNFEKLNPEELFSELEKIDDFDQAEIDHLEKLLKDDKKKDAFLKRFKKRMSNYDPELGTKISLRQRLSRLYDKTIETFDRSSANKPTKVAKGQYEFRGDRYRIPDQEVDDLIAAEKANGNKISKKEALQRLCEERSAVPRKMKTIPEGRVFRYKGETILIREGELPQFDSEADRLALLEKKYQAGEFMENADEFFRESTGTRPTSSPATDTTPSASKGKGPVLDSTPPKVETVSDAGKTASNAPEGTVKPSTEAVPERPQLVSQTEVDEALKQGRTEIDELEKAVKRAQRDVTLEKRTSGNVEEAKRILEQTKKAKKATEDSVRQLERMRDLAQKYRGTEDAAEQARLVSEFEDTAKSLRKSTEAAAEASSSIGRLSRLSQTLRALGVGLSIGGTAFSGYMAIDSFYTAATVDTAERSRIEALRGGMWTVDTAAGGVLTAGMMGYAGTGATTVAGRASAVLVPLTSAAENVFDTLSEDAMTEAEWAQSHSVNDLYHQWFSGISSISLGDAWVASVSKLEKAKDRRTKTLHEIYRVLIATERNPEILRYIQSTPPSQEKNDAIHQKIDAEYSKYHEYYFRQYPEKFRHGSSESIETYQEARQWIVDAELFHDLMTLREKKKGEGVSIYMIGNYNLMDSRFEIKGDVNHPNGHFYEPHLLVEAYKKGIVEEIESLDPMLSVNLHKMERHYLLSLCFQIDKTLVTPSNREQFARNPQFEPELKKMQQIIKDYLICERGINYEIAVRSYPEFANLPSSPESIRARLTELQSPITDEYDEYSETVSQNNPETHAMFELAEYFGYTGPKNEVALRGFFSEGTASYHGLYYRNRGGMRGPGWYLQERGMSYDDFMGEEITPQLVSNVIRRLRENAGNIFEHRRDSMLWSAKWYHKQCFEMANKLELGYQMGEINYGELPEQFKDWEVKDVAKKGEEKPDPKPEYARVIDDIKQKQNWPKLNYEVKNENTIKLSRTDSQEAVTLKKEGEYDASWTIDGLKNNLHLAQAVTLGNLLNHIKGIVSQSSYKARSAEPFYIGSTVWGEENIYFDNGVLNDLKLMDVSEGNLDWYNEIGITKEAIVDICNQWFKNRNAAPTTHPVSSGDRQS